MIPGKVHIFLDDYSQYELLIEKLDELIARYQAEGRRYTDKDIVDTVLVKNALTRHIRVVKKLQKKLHV